MNSKGMPSSSNASMSSRSVSTSDILRLQQHNQSNTNLSNPSIVDHSGSGRRVGNTRLVGFLFISYFLMFIVFKSHQKHI